MSESKITLLERLEILNQPIPPQALKAIGGKAGGTLTDINVGYAIHRMNEAFGPGGWCYSSEIVHHEAYRPAKSVKVYNQGQESREIQEGATEFLFVVRAQIELPDYEKVFGPMYNSHSKADPADALKGAQTGGFMQCLKYLGFGKEVYMGLYSNATGTYTGPIPETPTLQDAIMQLDAAQNKAELLAAWNAAALYHNDADFTEASQAAKKRLNNTK